MNWIFFGEEELGDSDRLPLARSLRRFLKSPLQELMPPVSLSFDLFFTRSSSRSARSPLRIKTLIMKNLNESDILLSAQQNSYQGITRAKKEDNTYGFSGIAVKWPYPKHSANPQLCNHPSQTAGTYPWHPHDRQITRRIIPIPESNIQLVRHLSYFNYISRPSPHRLISAKISLPQLHLSLRQWSAILINGLGGSSADVEAAATASNGEQGEGVILMKDDRADAEFHLGDNVVATSSSFLLKDGARCGRTFCKVAAVTLRKYKGYDPIPTGIAGVESRRARVITWTSRTIMLDIPTISGRNQKLGNGFNGHFSFFLFFCFYASFLERCSRRENNRGLTREKLFFLVPFSVANNPNKQPIPDTACSLSNNNTLDRIWHETKQSLGYISAKIFHQICKCTCSLVLHLDATAKTRMICETFIFISEYHLNLSIKVDSWTWAYIYMCSERFTRPAV